MERPPLKTPEQIKAERKAKRKEAFKKIANIGGKLIKAGISAANPAAGAALAVASKVNKARKKAKEAKEASFDFDQAQTSRAKERVLHHSTPNMKDYLTRHGIDEAKQGRNPLQLAGQVAFVKGAYEKKYLERIRPKFFTEHEFDRHIESEQYFEQLENFTSELEAQRGFLGFDGQDGSDVSHFETIKKIATAGKPLIKKPIESIIKSQGQKVVAKIAEKKKVQSTAKKLVAVAEKKTAQAKAISAGVPPKLVAQATANLTPQKATQVAKDLEQVYSGGTAENSEVAKEVGMSAMGKLVAVVLLASVIGAVVYFNKK